MVSGAPVGQDMVWHRHARSAFRESANGNGVVKQIGNTTHGGPAVVLTVGTTSVGDMWAVGQEGRMDLGAALAADDGGVPFGSSNNSSIRGSSNNRSNNRNNNRNNNMPHLSP